ncbi:hypothetical protein NUW58_g2645 [Xylaria curta]|uniref:Uncharacterized protein n=1 Tax=Xylaria curta TaxID=42375 RepID=A0ACC1PFI4_9PEZI|nr:hypothetical protein NUW58_g2645 [Xylaria curta]
MFSKLKSAVDRTLAEERARHRTLTEQRTNTNDDESAALLPKEATQKSSQGGSAHPDPAVYEAVIRPEDTADGSSTRTSFTLGGNATEGLGSNVSENEKSAQGQDGNTNKAASPAVSQNSELSPQVLSKLKRLEKLEASYHEVLRSYRIAYSQIKNFERALQENTPVGTIKDPAALIEYIHQFDVKSKLAFQELTRISTERDDLLKKTELNEITLTTLSNEIAALTQKAEAAVDEVDEARGGKALEGDKEEDMFSYDDELAEKIDRIKSLELQVDTLAKALENIKHKPNQSEDDSTVREPPQLELDDRDAKVKILEEQLQEAVASKEKAESILAANHAEMESLREELKSAKTRSENLFSTNSQMSKEISALTSQLETLKQADTTKRQPTSSKSKNKKKKKGSAYDESSEHSAPSHLEGSDVETLRVENARLKDQVSSQETQLSKLSKQKKSDEERQEEIADLQENLLTIGQEYVDAKKRIKEVENEKESLQVEAKALKSRISELEEKLASREVEYESKRKDNDELNIQLQTKTSDLGAVQKLAQDRFKENTNLRDIMTKLQGELKSLRQESTTLKATQEELASKQKELRTLEKREKELKNEASRIQHLASDRQSEIKGLNDRLSAERGSNMKLEDDKRSLRAEVRRFRTENAEAVAKAEKTGMDLEAARSELSKLRPKVKELESEVINLQKDNNLAKEDVNLKQKQYQGAHSLLESMRAQNKELQTQLKEAQSQAESLQEEVAEVQKHLAERTREAETMRRRLKEENEKADKRVHDMRAQMEAAIEDRDRIEDESATLGRRRAREAEELKNKARELDREVKALKTERDDLEAHERQWRQRREELEQIEEKATAETEDMRSTISSLRSALDASEQQVRDTEKQKANLRKLMEDAQNRFERTYKELKSVQSKLNPDYGADAMRNRGSSAGAADLTYLKTVFMQFLETEDVKVRSQLVPVLLKVLGFDK